MPDNLKKTTPDHPKNAGLAENVGFVRLVYTFGALKAIWKRYNMVTVFQGLNDFVGPKIWKFMQFCHIYQNVAIYSQRCSSTA